MAFCFLGFPLDWRLYSSGLCVSGLGFVVGPVLGLVNRLIYIISLMAKKKKKKVSHSDSTYNVFP